MCLVDLDIASVEYNRCLDCSMNAVLAFLNIRKYGGVLIKNVWRLNSKINCIVVSRLTVSQYCKF